MLMRRLRKQGSHNIMRTAIIGAILLSSHGAQAAIDLAKVDRLMESARLQWNQPGMALAIVDGGEPVYLKGYGVRDLKSKAPVTPDTLFGLGSCSKSFGAATVAKLVETNKLGWDDRVDRHMALVTNDPWVSHELRVRDLLSHHTGLEAGLPRDAVADRETYLRSIAFTKPLHPFRYQYSYTNDMFTAAGALVAKVANKNWDDFARNELWNPLGMSRTNADHRMARKDPDSAVPNAVLFSRSELVPIPWVYETDVALPSGGVNSSARDMARWIHFHIDEGSSDGAILPAAAFAEMHAPQTPLRGPLANGPLILSRTVGQGPQGYQFENYGMGWYVQSYRGQRMLYHAGRIAGFRCIMAMLPEQKFGFSILFNADYQALPLALMQSLIDMKLGLPEKDWSSIFQGIEGKMRAGVAGQIRKVEAARIPDAPPTRPLAAYVGTFANEAGSLDARIADGKLMVRLDRADYEAIPWHFDIFRLVPRTLRTDEGVIAWPHPVEVPSFISFKLDEMGEITGLETEFGEFERRANIKTN